MFTRYFRLYRFAAGLIPPELGHLAALRSFNLENNELSGESPGFTSQEMSTSTFRMNPVYACTGFMHGASLKTMLHNRQTQQFGTCQVVAVELQHAQLAESSQLRRDASCKRETDYGVGEQQK